MDRTSLSPSLASGLQPPEAVLELLTYPTHSSILSPSLLLASQDPSFDYVDHLASFLRSENSSSFRGGRMGKAVRILDSLQTAGERPRGLTFDL